MDSTISEADRELARRRGVVLVPYDPLWPVRYDEAAARIREASGDLLTDIQHIGSTSIPGIAAKPFLDLMPGLATHIDGFRLIPIMESLGYESRGEMTIPGRHYFTKLIEDDDRVWKHNVHAYATDHIEWTRHLVFRDALRNDNTLRDEYESLKRRLAVQYRDDVNAYAVAKSEFVERVIAAHGGPARPADFPPPPSRGPHA